MTPMIDVVFLLLIFFVCAASGQSIEDLLPTEMPPAGSVEAPIAPPEEEIPKVKLWIMLRRVDNSTVIEMNEREYDGFPPLEETLTNLAELQPENPVILDIEDDVPVGDMIRLYDNCRSVGFESISFAAEPAGE